MKRASFIFAGVVVAVLSFSYGAGFGLDTGKLKERFKWCTAFHGVLIDGHCVAGNQVLDPERIGK